MKTGDVMDFLCQEPSNYTIIMLGICVLLFCDSLDGLGRNSVMLDCKFTKIGQGCSYCTLRKNLQLIGVGPIYVGPNRFLIANLQLCLL